MGSRSAVFSESVVVYDLSTESASGVTLVYAEILPDGEVYAFNYQSGLGTSWFEPTSGYGMSRQSIQVITELINTRNDMNIPYNINSSNNPTDAVSCIKTINQFVQSN